MRRRPLRLLAVGLVAIATGCGGVAADQPTVAAPAGGPGMGTTTTEATTTTAPPTTTTTLPPPPPRVARVQAWEPFATTGELVLHHPSSLVERIGFHESNHDGAQPLTALASAVAPSVLESRERGTAPSTAADIVVQPGTEVRAPVTGTVLRAGSYVLYCRHTDEYLVVEPDDHPGWEVKVLHIAGLLVAPGDRVEAGVTAVAAEARQLAFESQVDELRTVDPAWPHVHLEVVDPAIPDRPTPGGGCTP